MRRMEPLAENVHIAADGSAVEIVDQTKLPGEYVLKRVRTAQEMYDAIQRLEVRGAPAIGIFAGYCMYALAEQMIASDHGHFRHAPGKSEVEAFLEELEKKAAFLRSSRPTAVNLAWALDRMMKTARDQAAMIEAARAAKMTGSSDRPVSAEPAAAQIVQALGDEAVLIQKEDIEMCRKISAYGLSILKDGDGVLTHCNAGPLATSRYGTAIGPVLLAQEQGIHLRAFADETRPLLQGARLTAYELQKAGVDVTLICDNMASIVMKNGWVDACFVGCDRVAANGDAANKIGTSGVAILAKHYGIPFYVLGPSSTIDLSCETGADIPIELRDGEEIRSMHYAKPMAPEGVKCFNPAFDVTDHELIAGIITEKGIVRPPFKENLARLFG